MHARACTVCMCVWRVKVLRGHMRVLRSWHAFVYMYCYTYIHVRLRTYVCTVCGIVYSRVSWLIDSNLIRACLHVDVHIHTYARWVQMCGVRADYVCTHSYLKKNSKTIACMSLHALHDLFINLLCVTWWCTTQTYVGFACVLCAKCTYTP